MKSIIQEMPLIDADPVVNGSDERRTMTSSVTSAMTQESAEAGTQWQPGQKAMTNDPVARCNADLYYRFQKSQIELEKNAVLLEQRKNYEAWHKELTERYRVYLQLMGCMVYSDQNGDLMYAITNGANQNVGTKRLLNVRNYSVQRLFCCFPKLVEALEISWEGQIGKEKIFWIVGEEKSGNAFLRRLKSRGVQFLVSGRSEKQAADALLAYSYTSAGEKEIPWQHGWGMNASRRWHFAKDTELTMREVLKCTN